MREVPVAGFHVRGFALEPVEQFGIGGSEDFVDAMDLVELAGAIKKRILGDHFKQHTTVPPHVHLGVVVTISHQTLRRAVPSCRDVLGVRMLAVNTSNYRISTLARPKIRQLNHASRNQHILRLDVPMEDAHLVDVHD